MQGFHFLIKFGLVLIYVSMVYRKKVLFDFIEKNVQSITCIFLLKTMHLLKFRNVSLLKIKKLLPALFSRNFLVRSCFYIIPNVWSIQFGLCSMPIIYFLLFFFFNRYLPWQTLTIRRIAGEGEGIIIFLVFNLHQLTNFHLVHWDFYDFFLLKLVVITRLIAYKTCFP